MFFTLFLSTFAHATLYEVELSIGDDQAELLPTTSSLVVGRVLKGIATGQPDGTIASTSPYIQCEIIGGDVHVTAKVDPNNWGVLPSSADCSYQAHTLRVFPITNAPFFDWMNSPISITPPKRLVIQKPPQQLGYRTHLLPSSGTYEAGVSDGILADGTPWTGLTCETGQGASGAWYLRIDINNEALTYGKGSCEIANSSGLPYTLRLQVKN